MPTETVVTVHFLDGEKLEGILVEQDDYNITLLLDGEDEVMIPRSQVRFMKRHRPHTPAPGESTSPSPPEVSASQTSPAPLPAVSIPEEPAPNDPDDITFIVDDGAEAEADVIEFPFPGTHDDDDDETTLVVEPEESDDNESTFIIEGGYDTADDEDEDTFIFDNQEPEPPKELVARLVCTAGPHAGESFDLKSDVTTIGRSTDNVVTLSYDKEISRRHAIVKREDDQFTIFDQNSLNGTFVNNERISEPRTLTHSDVVMVGVSYLEYQEH